MACATVHTTAPGAIGLERRQYFADGARETLRREGAMQYAGLVAAARRQGTLNADPAMTRRLIDIANRLVRQVAPFRPDALGWEWELNVLSVEAPNASCIAGGKILVHAGLVRQWAPSDDELAAVIGHEIGHALREHGAEKYSTSRRNDGIASGIGAVLSVGLVLTTGINAAEGILQTSQASAQAFANLPNSRALEHEADRIGLELMARSGYDPHAAVTLWTKVAALRAGGGEGFWSTHPPDDARIADLGAFESRVRPLYEAAAGRLPAPPGDRK